MLCMKQKYGIEDRTDWPPPISFSEFTNSVPYKIKKYGIEDRTDWPPPISFSEFTKFHKAIKYANAAKPQNTTKNTRLWYSQFEEFVNDTRPAIDII
nr:4026_t:CDS:2 [Entrophospora candida]